MPVPSISGTPPSSAHIVVIRIGRKRRRHASWIASSGVSPRSRSADQREVDQHDAVLLHDADQQDDADDADHVERQPNSIRVSSAPSPAEGRVEMIVIGWIVLS